MGQAVDQRADIYAFGLILYDMVTGRRQASRGECGGGADGADEARAGGRTIDSTLPEALEMTLTRCLEPDPANRYQTNAELSADLDALNADGVAVRRLDTASRRPVEAAGPRISKRAALYGAALALLVVLAGVAADRLLRDRTSGADAGVVAATSPAVLPFGNATGDQSLDSLGLALADIIGPDPLVSIPGLIGLCVNGGWVPVPKTLE